MSFSVAEVLPRYFMVVHSALLSTPKQNYSVSFGIDTKVFCLNFKGIFLL